MRKSLLFLLFLVVFVPVVSGFEVRYCLFKTGNASYYIQDKVFDRIIIDGSKIWFGNFSLEVVSPDNVFLHVSYYELGDDYRLITIYPDVVNRTVAINMIADLHLLTLWGNASCQGAKSYSFNNVTEMLSFNMKTNQVSIILTTFTQKVVIPLMFGVAGMVMMAMGISMMLYTVKNRKHVSWLIYGFMVIFIGYVVVWVWLTW